MSVHYSSAAWKWAAPESSIKLVLLKLADSANDDGLSWPSLARICGETGLSMATVCEKLTWLEGSGIVSRERSLGGRANTRYVIHISKLSAKRTTDDEWKLSAKRTVRQPESSSPPAGEPALRQLETNHQVTVIKPSSGPAGPGGGAASNSGNGSDAHGSGLSAGPDLEKKDGARRRDECFEALVEVQGSRLDSLTKSERGMINRALCEIRHAMPAVTATEIRARADAYRKAMPRLTLTAITLAGWWSRLGKKNGATAGTRGGHPMDREPEGQWRGVAQGIIDEDGLSVGDISDVSWRSLPGEFRERVLERLEKRKGAA